MQPGADILNELQQAGSILATMDRVNVFTVPEDYFDNLSVLPTLYAGSRQVPFEAAPDGYFQQLADRILVRVKGEPGAAEERETLSPLLYKLQQQQVLEVPAHYFEHFPQRMLNKIVSQEKVIRINWRTTVLKYAAAAMVIGFLTLSIFRATQTPHPRQAVQVASLDASVIRKGQNMNDEQFNSTLNNLSADDITSYLEKNGGESDIIALSAAIDDNTLPTQDDYMTNQSALNQYLENDEQPVN